MRALPRISRFACLLFASTALAAPVPLVNAVYNAASWVPAGLPNSGIAEGSIFTLIGTGMGPGTLVQVTSYHLPTSQGLAGTTVQVTVGGVTNYCIMVYTFATQVAAILPSSTPVGTGTLTLSYQGAQSTSIAITVVKNSVGIFAVNQEGSGPGVITNLSYQVQVPTNSAHPGDILILWGTGLGPVTGNETEPPVPVDLGTGVQIFVGGQSATVLYGGRGSSAGLDQINFMVPAGLSGCYVSVVAQVNGVVSNFTTIPITAPGQTYCSDGASGFSSANLAKLQNGGTINVARLDLDNIAGDNASAIFEQWSFLDLISSHGVPGGPSVGNCTVYDVPSGNGIVVLDPFSIPGLNAGSQVSITGPNGNKTLSQAVTGTYLAQLSALGATPFISPGTYTFSNGSGGTDIGPITASVTYPGPLIWTNEASIKSVSVSHDLTITWSGGSASDYVTIIGITGLASIKQDTEFFCNAQASAGTFTIPPQVLALLPPAGIDSELTPGIDFFVGLVTPATVTAPNLDYGFLFSDATVVTVLPIVP
jgi:uncharacterized protein (TIGR03437 family)